LAWPTVDQWLGELASDSATPGGGGASALTAAASAALISMVCNLSIGRPRYAEHELLLTGVLRQVTERRELLLGLAEADAEAFQTVLTAYKLPRSSEAEQQERAAAIQAALAGAAEVPLRVAAIAADLIRLAGDISGRSNPSVLSDVAVAAVLARAALDSAVVNVEVNLAGLDEGQQRSRLAGQLASHASAAGAEAEAVIREARARIGGSISG
jgi:formiminotetrahydrofolate cyclodeaminase